MIDRVTRRRCRRPVAPAAPSTGTAAAGHGSERSRRAAGDRRDPHPAGQSSAAEDGSAILLGGVSLVVVTLVLVVALDLTAYLVAAARAQSAADAAALAAVTVSHPQGRSPGLPEAEARRLAAAAGARLETCTCPPGAELVAVEVSVAVPALVVTRWAARRVSATAEAHLVPPAAGGS